MTVLRRSIPAVLVALTCLSRVESSRAGDAPVSPRAIDSVEPTNWDGFLWRDSTGHLRIGTPLIGEQFMPGDPRVVPETLAKALSGWAVANGDEAYHFAFALVRPDAEATKDAPRFLVRLRVEFTLGVDGRRRVEGARLLAVERLDEAWLRAWRPLFLHEASPWRGRKDGAPSSIEGRKAFLQFERAALDSMRKVAEPGADLLAAAGKIDPSAVVFARFRRRVESDIAREIATESKALKLAIPSLDPTVPPSPWDTLPWIVESKTKAEFLARAAKEWKGEATDLDISHYDATLDGSSRWHVISDLATIRDTWTEEGYARRRVATIDVEQQK